MIKPFTEGWVDECWGRLIIGIGSGKARNVLYQILEETARDRFAEGRKDVGPKPVIHDLMAEDLVKRVLSNLKPRNTRKGEKVMRWAVVMDHFNLGSTFSKDLCRKYNLDPDEMLKR